MSEPKRYHHFIKFYSKSFTDVTGARYCYPDAGMIEDKDGKYVEYEDYARLRSVAEDNKRECEATRIENARLKAEVERLTVAEEALAAYNDGDVNLFVYFHGIWNAAKEGKPRA